MNHISSLFFFMILYCFAPSTIIAARLAYLSDNPKTAPHAAQHKSIKYRIYSQTKAHPNHTSYSIRDFNQGRKQVFYPDVEPIGFEEGIKSEGASSTRSRVPTSPIQTEEYYSFKKVKNESFGQWHHPEELIESPFQDLLLEALPSEDQSLDSEQTIDCEDFNGIDGFIHEVDDPETALEESESFNDLNLAFGFEKDEQKKQYKNHTKSTVPGKRDILCSEDPIANAHSGNVTFTALINCKAYAYVVAKLTNNIQSQEEIIQYIQEYFATDSESGFIYESKGSWFRISKNDASTKIKKILDACYTNIFAALEESKQNRFQYN